MNKNCLIFGAGSKFGADLSNNLAKQNNNVYRVTSTPKGQSGEIEIDWQTCDFVFVEKILRGLPVIDLVVFNQNFCQTPEIIDLSINKPKSWKQGQAWVQSHFVNCVLPCQVLTSLIIDGKFTNASIALWMLSGIIYNDQDTKLLGYLNQKRLNKDIIKSASQNNSIGKFIGLDPGSLTAQNRDEKSKVLATFLTNGVPNSLFYRFNHDATLVETHDRLN